MLWSPLLLKVWEIAKFSKNHVPLTLAAEIEYTMGLNLIALFNPKGLYVCYLSTMSDLRENKGPQRPTFFG